MKTDDVKNPQRYRCDFVVSIDVHLVDKKKVLDGFKGAMYDISPDNQSFLMLNFAQAIAKQKLMQKLNNEEGYTPFSVEDGDVSEVKD